MNILWNNFPTDNAFFKRLKLFEKEALRTAVYRLFPMVTFTAFEKLFAPGCPRE